MTVHPQGHEITTRQFGPRLPGYCTALGKAILANKSDSELNAYLEDINLIAYTPNTIKDRQLFAEDLNQTRARGYSISRMEILPHQAGLGAPLLDIAAKETLRAKPDGYALCFSVALTYAAWPYMTKVKYTEDDFTYISAVGKFQEAFVSLPDKGWSDWKGLIAYAKKQGPINVAVMTPYDKQVLRYIAKKEGVQFNLVPTKGGAAIMTQILNDSGYAPILKNLERDLRQYLDPEAIDAQAKADQAELVRLFGGRDKAFRTGTKGATPAPGQGSE